MKCSGRPRNLAPGTTEHPPGTASTGSPAVAARALSCGVTGLVLPLLAAFTSEGNIRRPLAFTHLAGSYLAFFATPVPMSNWRSAVLAPTVEIETHWGPAEVTVGVTGKKYSACRPPEVTTASRLTVRS